MVSSCSGTTEGYCEACSKCDGTEPSGVLHLKRIKARLCAARSELVLIALAVTQRPSKQLSLALVPRGSDLTSWKRRIV
ncbi:hypothetical protein F2P81_010142 [Scophthalmus maximus]|uniref:Uncharacterized protein n=1 Tax=Scophthalmus maximus TaxID=52904 RepID=A0A6A4SYZ8_SCOMX|nr:hypothetical protein F2P81_010142 [Scophthalmus maximus]